MSRPADELTRRSLIATGGAAALTTVACGGGARPAHADEPHEEEEVSPNEDLMREHGLLERLLLVYEESATRLDGGGDLPIEALAGAAGIMRRFVEDYHEKLEEEHVFPRLERAEKLVELVATLREQHHAGRRLTDAITALAKPAAIAAEGSRRQLSGVLRAYLRMYRPHAAREDTVVFPSFRDVVSANEYAALGEAFEEKEHALFGEDGFTGMVEAVSQLERALGIDDLAAFTPT
jgi:hemerythrin-like domain-containing protein